jgi:molybdopterin-containing oxidoreductase family membrane subunit
MIKKEQHRISSYIDGFVNRKMTLRYTFALLVASLLSVTGLAALVYTLQEGLSVWGINNRISWGFAIVNFVFWIGIAHAGTLISGILYLLNQKWRKEYNRMAELMTLISVIIAATFPVIHTGRPWFALYWLLPYYNKMSLLPNFKSPLTWDIVAIFSYFVISLIFFYIGIMPDLSLLKSKNKSKWLNKLYKHLSFAWNGTKAQWEAHRTIYLLIAGLVTPLVISVHSIVSFDFYVTNVASWHTAILPPYFVVGAVFSGLAMVNVISLIYNYLCGTLDSISQSGLDKINKLILFASLVVGFVYLIEFSTMYVENEWKTAFYPLTNGGIYVYLMLIFNVLAPILLFFKVIRRGKLTTFIISLLILVGMWLERYIIFISGQELYTNNVENSLFSPTLIDWLLLAGSFGIFFLVFLLSARFIPMYSIYERSFDD